MELVGSAWTLVSFETETGVISVAAEAPSTLIFAAEGEQAGRLSGNGGCNRYFASYTLADDRLSISPIGSTRMMCSPDRMVQEDRFFQALSTAERYERSSDELLIIYADGTLRFTPAMSHTGEA
ncbi:MAG: META domain-containing protein [Ktedonobacteraceae bacterium]|nr:META domain-containing protein [Ktedonobacteraceae bacterium]